MVFILKSSICILQLPASGDGRHYRNTITVLDRRGVLLQVADVLVIEVDIHKGTQFAFVRIKMPAQLRMLRHEVRQRVTDCASLHINCRQLASILPQRGRYVDLGHRLYMMPQDGPEIQGTVWGGQTRPPYTKSGYFNLLAHKLLIVFIHARQFERIGKHGLALFYTGNHVRTAKPVRLGKIGR